MSRRVLSHIVVVFAVFLTLTGCLLNTPEQVVKRFIGHLKAMEWSEMASLVDWPQSSQYFPGLPTTNKGEDEKKKEVMQRIAENLSHFPVRTKTPDQTQHEFLYLKIANMKYMTKSKRWAWLEVEITLDARAKTVQILVMKINRLWRVVLTDSLLK